MRTINTTLLLLVACGAGSLALAEEHRQHGVHEHGGGELNVAVEQKALIIELSVPAMNIVGFEHQPHNSQEQDQAQHAAEILKDGEHVFGPSPAAKCTLSKVQVKSVLLKNTAQHDAKGHAEEHHADFDANYEFICLEPSQLSALNLTLFKRFPATRHLRTQVIGPGGQSAAELSADKATLHFK